MNDWINEPIALALYDSDEVIQGKLVSVEPFGLIISVTRKNKAAKPFDGLFSETDIELFISWMKIRYCAHADTPRVT